MIAFCFETADLFLIDQLALGRCEDAVVHRAFIVVCGVSDVGDIDVCHEAGVGRKLEVDSDAGDAIAGAYGWQGLGYIVVTIGCGPGTVRIGASVVGVDAAAMKNFGFGWCHERVGFGTGAGDLAIVVIPALTYL